MLKGGGSAPPQTPRPWPPPKAAPSPPCLKCLGPPLWPGVEASEAQSSGVEAIQDQGSELDVKLIPQRVRRGLMGAKAKEWARGLKGLRELRG